MDRVHCAAPGTVRAVIMLVLCAPLLAARSAGAAASQPHTGRALLQTGPNLRCDLDATQSCNVLDDQYTTTTVLYAEGYIFLMTANGVMLRCSPNDRYSCITFNTLSTKGGCRLAALSPGYIIATSGNDMVKCSIYSANSCQLLNQCDPSNYYKSLIVANNRIYAGLDSGVLWSCDMYRTNSCQNLDYAGRDNGIATLAYDGSAVWAGIDNGVVWRCDPNKVDSCITWEKAGVAVESMVVTNDQLYVGLSNGVMWKCPKSRTDACTTLNTLGAHIRAMVMVPGQDTTIYVGNVNGVFRCPIDQPDSCVTVAQSKIEIHDFATAALNSGVNLFAAGYVTTCNDRSGCYISAAGAYWMVLDSCPDRTVVSILQAQIANSTGMPWNISSASAAASFSGTAINQQAQQQSITYGLTVTRTVTVTVSWQNATKNGWKVDVKNPLFVTTPFASDVTAGYSNEVTITDGTSTTTTSTETSNALIQNIVPPHSSCSVNGTVSTSMMSWSQEYDVTVMYKCGATGQERWVADISASDILTTSSKFTATWLPCDIIPMPPITATCSSNPGCAYAGLTGNCCPQADGTYQACCAQAIAHMSGPNPCIEGIDFLFPNQTICPNVDWTYQTCCPPVTRPKTVTTGLRFVNASGAAADCGANSYDAGMRVGAAGLRMCVDTAAAAGDRVLPNEAGKLLSDVTVVAGRRAFAALRCPTGYSKHETDINGEAAAAPRGASMALCMKRAPAGTPVRQLVKSVLLHPTCKQPKLEYTRRRGNLNSQAAGQPSAFVCLGYAAGGL